MLAFLNNKKIYCLMVFLFLFGILCQLVEGKVKKRVYTDKLELIRDFILENYPINPEHYIEVHTSTGVYQNFWFFGVSVGDLYAFEPSSKAEKVDTEYNFIFQITAEYELTFFHMTKGKIEEKLQKAKEELKKEKEINFENVRELLIKMGAKYPLEPGEIIRSQDDLIVRYPPEGGSKSLKKYLLKRESLWKFLGERKPEIERMSFFIKTIEPRLLWSVHVKIGGFKYVLEIEPFWGYIIEIDGEWPENLSTSVSGKLVHN